MSDLSVLTLFLHPRLQCNVVYVHLTRMPAYTRSLKNSAVNTLSYKVTGQRIKLNRFSFCVLRCALKNYWHSMQSCKTIEEGGMRYSRSYTFCFVYVVAIHAIFVSAVPPDLTGIQNDQMDSLINVFVLIICRYLSLIRRKFMSSNYPSPLWPGSY